MNLQQRPRFWIVFAAAAIAWPLLLNADEPNASGRFAALLDEAWEFRLREDPLFASETGDHRYDDQLPKVSLADEKRRDAARRDFAARLRAIDRGALSSIDQVNYDVFGRALRDQLGEYRF